ncbi:MAG: imidazole glycerol phosphate synthase subunit HisF [Gammaproteobacteria bacterium]|nr:imidazole glycerol phosphate synthase subunit HisF [Gammaproteobacteria bacterium]
MLRSRIIPCLLVRNKGLVKTVGFADAKYVGDPINAVRIFNEKEVDELMVIDIDATVQGRSPDYDLIGRLAAECRMPLCYGGGVKTRAQIEKIVALGVEKVALSSAIVESSCLVAEASSSVGAQSIVAVLDVKKAPSERRYEVYTHNGTRPTGKCPVATAKLLEEQGVGEIALNSIDNDGRMEGYDFDLIELVSRQIRRPITCLGGAGSLGDIEKLIVRFGPIGAAAGSLFVFKGAYRAVLINYPSQSVKEALFRKWQSTHE